MIKLEIINKNDYEYKVKDESGQIYILNLEFFDIQEAPKEKDYIYISEKLLDNKYDGYSTSYTFGELDSIYGKENIELNDVDVIKLVINKNEIYLKRIYG